MSRNDLDLLTTLLVLAVGGASFVLLLQDLVRRELAGRPDDRSTGYARRVGLGLAIVFAYLVVLRFALLGT